MSAGLVGANAGTPGLGDIVTDYLPADHPFEYEVIGEHLVDPLRLLTVDGEGRLFELNLGDGTASPTELTADWIIDIVDTTIYRRRGDGGSLRSHTLVVG